jgi:SAM-dependent methyltransferase
VTRELVARWDAQQAAYIAGREARFDAMLDVLSMTLPDDATVVDLACGPGSLASRVLDRLPGVSVVAIDLDPVLLELARRELACFGERARVVDADLTDASWADVLGGPVHAAVSTTALHWLAPDELVRLYGQVAGVLRPGGVLLDGDHLRFDGRHPVARDWAARHDAATQAAAFAAGADTWDGWWADVRADPELGALVPERERRFAGRLPTGPSALDFRLAALAQAGFDEVGTVWQLFDDYVVYGVR